jgi:signal transduction histidine kinase
MYFFCKPYQNDPNRPSEPKSIMRIASVPFNEELRLQDLYSYDILDSEKEKDFDELLQVAAHIYGCPIAAISFIDRERQWLKSKIGLEEITETSREVAFCAHTILQNDVFIVEDATKDERFCENPLVLDNPSIRFYAGAPVVSTSGYRLGSICVIDTEPRMLSKQEARMLQILSSQISKLLELRQKNQLLREKAKEEFRLQKRMLQTTLKKHEAEKQSISTVLHENIAQSLAASKFYLEIAETDGMATKDLLGKTKGLLSSIVDQVRDLSQSISPSLLQEAEVKPLLTALLSQFHNQSGLEVQLLYEGDQTLSSAVVLPIYRIVEAQLQNIKSHARATSVVVNIHVFSAIYLSVKDNGVGFDQKNFHRGAGLTTILHNAEMLNGKVEIISGVKGGCELIATLAR